MKTTKTMPESGQFVAIWEYNCCAWCTTHKFEDGMLMKYIEHETAGNDAWCESPDHSSFYEEVGAEFIVFGGCK
jgi:hypothetical protein